MYQMFFQTFIEIHLLFVTNFWLRPYCNHPHLTVENESLMKLINCQGHI